VVVDPQIGDAELRRMDDAGVRGVRFNLVTAGGLPADALPALARRIAPLGWHLQLFIEGEQLRAMAPMLRTLPVEIVVDHMGQIMTAAGVEAPAVGALLGLLDSGRAWVKLSGYRSSSAGYPVHDVAPLARHLIGRHGERCVWGTDWPHPGFDGTMPDDGELFDLLAQWAPDEAVRRRILVDNPAALYRFAAQPAAALKERTTA
jgi:predicted TIM-barrel fold metal-dependent hydrolase